jgi:chromosome segregation ATPase
MENPSDPKNFASLAEATEAYSALQGELDAATALSEEAGANLATAQTERDQLRAELETATAQIENLATAANQLGETINGLTEELNALKATERSAEQRAAEIAASSGTAPVENAHGAEAGSAWEQYSAIKEPGAKVAFWRANQAEIIRTAPRS